MINRVTVVNAIGTGKNQVFLQNFHFLQYASTDFAQNNTNKEQASLIVIMISFFVFVDYFLK